MSKFQSMNKSRYYNKGRIYIEKTVNLFYPSTCPLCGKILKESEGMVHRTCQAAIEEISEPKCKRCGKPILSEHAEFCRDCYKKHKYFDQNAALWVYDGMIRQAVLDYKYSGMRSYTSYFAAHLAAGLGWWIRSKQPEILIPVPIHKKKKRIRGYNQAGLLADELSHLVGIPVIHDLLVRVKYTDPQKKLTPDERRKNLEKAIEVHKPEKKKMPECVMIIDDIYTTGSTLDACAAVLKRAGVVRVYGVTLCIGDTDRGK